MLDARALALSAAPSSSPQPVAAVAAPADAGGVRWPLALLGLSLLLILTSVFSPALAASSRVFDRISDRRAEVAGIGLVVLAALLVTGGAGL